ncbi:MAG: hypothetical protein ACTSW1_11645 [Candidatus Hodarchaeales archaeon]
MFSEFLLLHNEGQIQKNKDTKGDSQKALKPNKEDQTPHLREQKEEEVANRALLLLSFKGTSTQNLKHVLNVLGIRTMDDKRKILNEIYRLIRQGVIYVPKGLPELVDRGIRFDKDDPDEENIDLCLLRPFDELIKEIQDEITALQLDKD